MPESQTRVSRLDSRFRVLTQDPNTDSAGTVVMVDGSDNWIPAAYIGICLGPALATVVIEGNSLWKIFVCCSSSVSFYNQ